ncbi:PTS sugar transporter subunit IIA [Enterococcus faecalis]
MTNRPQLVIATHGFLAESLAETSKMIIGEQAHLHVICLKAGMNLSIYQQNLKEIVEQYIEHGVLVMVDLLGGTPFNTLISLLEDERVSFVTGVNLPMLLDILAQPDTASLQEMTEIAQRVGQEGIKSKKDFLQI